MKVIFLLNFGHGDEAGHWSWPVKAFTSGEFAQTVAELLNETLITYFKINNPSQKDTESLITNLKVYDADPWWGYNGDYSVSVMELIDD